MDIVDQNSDNKIHTISEAYDIPLLSLIWSQG